MFRKIAALLLMSVLAAGSALGQQPGRKVDAMQPVADSGMQMVESEGQVFFMTNNGRYVIKGQIFDLWDGSRPLRNVKEMEYSNTHLPLSKMNLKLDDLLTLTTGRGPKQATIFVSPGCPYCHKTLAMMKGLEEEYTFNVVPLPILGPNSEKAVLKIACSYKKAPQAALNALIEDRYDQLPEAGGSCDLDPMKRSVIAGQFLGIDSVPVVVADDGRVLKGAPRDLKSFLQ